MSLALTSTSRGRTEGQHCLWLWKKVKKITKLLQPFLIAGHMKIFQELVKMPSLDTCVRVAWEGCSKGTALIWAVNKGGYNIWISFLS